MAHGSHVPSRSHEEFPMFTVPSETFLQMTILQPHEELMDADVLCKFEDSMGKAMFISHQWITSHHPDPHFEQLRVLQQAVQGLIAGTTRVTLPTMIELSWGRLQCPTSADFRGALYMWYDYFCCPQGKSIEAAADRQRAIDSIHHYVAKCHFFIILCPSVLSSPDMSFSTWAARGWCRLERMARELAREEGYIITIKIADHPTLAWNSQGMGKAPGLADFSVESDKKRIGNVLVRMVWSKLQYLLDVGDVHNYRFLLNLHHKYFEGIPDITSLDSLVPAHFETDVDPTIDPDAFLVQRFLHDNLFKGLSDRDSAGWSPICYAALTNNPTLVKALLASRANVNDRTTKKGTNKNMPKHVSVLSIAATYHSNDLFQILVSAGAAVNSRCAKSGTALMWSAITDNASAIRPLLDAKVDPNLKCVPNVKVFRAAVGCGSVDVMAELLKSEVQVSLRYCLHGALVFNGEIDAIALLIDASANVNEQLRIPMRSTWWAILKGLQCIHYVSPSTLTYLAYHHSGATPLIFSILTGKFDTIPLLLKAGARWDIPNDRGKTAWHFCQETQVPIAWNFQIHEDDDASNASDDTFGI